MNDKSKSMKSIIMLAIIGVVVFGIIFGGISLTKNLGKSKKVVTTENAMDKLDKLYRDITVNNVTPRKEPVTLEVTSVKDTLPEISKYPAQVENTTDNYIEIFSSPEKTGEGKDGWLNEVAEAFNNAGITVNNMPVSVRIRGIASGMGVDYITSGKYLPDAFTPSNELWGEMMLSNGTDITLAEEKLVGNVAGVLISKKKQEELVQKYGSINLKVITEAVAANEIAMGYTNPFASSTGLNFLISTLLTFDEKSPLSDTAIQGFETFQTNIPFVAYTTLQMRESARSGVLDGFIMEYQTYVNASELKSDYVFTPFGVRHDSPVYEVGQLSDEKKAILNKFIEFCKTDENQKLATEDGFNNLNDYKPETAAVDGATIMQAQKLWKEKKDGANDIAAVFVADISGSMEGDRLNKLKESLLNGSQYIGKDNSVGLVTFSSDVNINLPIGKFDINQRSLFAGAVTDMQANGSTAMFDAIVVASKMLLDEKAKNPDSKLMLFVLTDGETNQGCTFNNIVNIIEVLKIPIYTIGYNANIDVLENISNINEAASINADIDDVIYKLINLFNAQM